jgi:hypothetical protein
MVDSLPTSSRIILKRAIENVEEILSVVSHKSCSSDELVRFTNLIREARHALDVLKIIRGSTFFVPLPLNAGCSVTPEDLADLKSCIVLRVLYCHFCINMTHGTFRARFRDYISQLTVSEALEVILADMTMPDEMFPSSPPKAHNARGVLMIDELASIRDPSKKDEFLGLIKDGVLSGLFLLFFLLFPVCFY